jgi:hypothetical protein
LNKNQIQVKVIIFKFFLKLALLNKDHIQSSVIEVGEKSPKSYLVLPLAPVTKEKD